VFTTNILRLAARVEINRAKIEVYKSVARRRRPLASSTSSPTKLLNGAARLPAVGGDASTRASTRDARVSTDRKRETLKRRDEV